MYFVLTKDDCIWCDKAKQLLEEKGEAYTASFLNDHPLLLKLMKKANLKTVPQIWDGAEYVGGYTELERKLNAR
jgi:glutaredoxin